MNRPSSLLTAAFALIFAACGGAATSPVAPSVPGTGPGLDAAPDAPRACAASLQVVRSLAKPVRITAYVTPGSPRLDAFVGRLRAVLERLKQADPSHVDYTVVDARRDLDRQAAKIAGLQEIDLVTEGEENVQGVMGVVVDYGNERDKLAVLSPTETTGLEYLITTKILAVQARGEKTKHRIGLLTGHDEIKLSEPNLVAATSGQSPNLQRIIEQYFAEYAFVDVDPRAAIDETLAGLIVMQPAKDLPDDDLRRIDAFVMKGKPLAVFASAVNVPANDPTMVATLSTHRLDALLGGYGIELRKDVLEDFGRPFSVSVMTKTGTEKLRFPALLQLDADAHAKGDASALDVSFVPFFRLGELMFPYASSLVLHRERQPDVPKSTFRIVARSSAETARETAGTINLAPLRQWSPKGPFARYDVAAVLEGKVRSAFQPTVVAKPGARVLVVASSQLFANPFARAGNPPPQTAMMGGGGDEILQALAAPYAQHALTNAILVAKSTLDWMAMDAALPGCAGLPD